MLTIRRGEEIFESRISWKINCRVGNVSKKTCANPCEEPSEADFSKRVESAHFGFELHSDFDHFERVCDDHI